MLIADRGLARIDALAGALDVSMSRILISVVCGTVCGSFAGVVAERVPRGESVVSGRSRCLRCDAAIAWRDLVPILSWVALRGRCRACSEPIGATPIVVEMATAAVFALCAAVFASPIEVLAHWILCTGLVSLTVIDIRIMKLPRRIIHVTALLGASVLAAAALSTDRVDRLYTAFLGAALALGFMFALYVASRGRLGDGDVRLSPLLGMFLGWQSISAVASGLLVSFHLGALGGLAAMAAYSSKRTARSRRPDVEGVESSAVDARRNRAIPFGPYLAVGTILTVLLDVDVLDIASHVP